MPAIGKELFALLRRQQRYGILCGLVHGSCSATGRRKPFSPTPNPSTNGVTSTEEWRLCGGDRESRRRCSAAVRTKSSGWAESEQLLGLAFHLKPDVLVLRCN